MSSDPKPRRGRPSSGAAKTTVTVGGLLRKTVYFDDEEWQAIRRASYDADVAFSDVVRTAVRRDLGLPDDGRHIVPKRASSDRS